MKNHNIKYYLDKRKNSVKKVYSFGSAVRLRRLELQMTLAQIAKDICSISYLSKIENNLIIPSAEKRLLIEERLQLKLLSMTPEHFEKLTEQWISYVYLEDQEVKKMLENYPIEENHYGLFHEFMLSNTIKSKNDMPLSRLVEYFNYYTDENIALILFVTAKELLRKNMGQQAFEVIRWLDINDYQDHRLHYIYNEILIELSFDCHKIHIIEQYFKNFLDRAILLQNMNKVNKLRDKVNALLAIYYSNVSLTTVQEDFVDYVKYFLNQQTDYNYNKNHQISHSVIFSYKSDKLDLYMKNLENLENDHIVYQYLQIKNKNQKDKLIAFIREMLINQPISQYDFITIHFILNEAISDLIDLHFYKEATMLAQKLILTSNILKKA